MPEPPLTTLERWESFGALWRLKQIADGEALVELCSCHGEAVGELRSGDPELLRYLAARPTSEAPAPQGRGRRGAPDDQCERPLHR